MLPDGYAVRELRAGDAAELASAYARNREHLAPWEPVRDDDFFTEPGQASAVAAQLASVRAGLSVAWVLITEGRVIGRVNLNNIVLGVLRSASVGYWVDQDHQGRGLATGAVRFVIEATRARGLHRLEAGTLLHNHASQRVLAACGFRYYGTAERYLFIAGRWQDHKLYQLLLHDRPL